MPEGDVAEDGIRVRDVTGVQTCALPISLGNTGFQPVQVAVPTSHAPALEPAKSSGLRPIRFSYSIIICCSAVSARAPLSQRIATVPPLPRSEERRVGKECRCRRGT